MERSKVIFLDDGGVMNNNAIRSVQWRELVALFFVPRFGGSHYKWKEANTYAFANLWKIYESRLKNDPYIDYNLYKKKEMEQWILDTFEIMEIEAPDIDTRLTLSKEASEWITNRVRSGYPGVVETIKLLVEKGFMLCTASGEASHELNGYLTGMGIREYFSNLFGPDLINTIKASPRFYHRIFYQMRIDPTKAIVVDDSPDAIDWAATTGAKTIHVLHSEECHKNSCDYHISSLEEIILILD
ncbi:MAG: HAD family hydrolase [Candidatus Hodarchaeales archaeon]|jgi:HAD superfamily hydrolase (TIGR01509 family)